MSTPKFTDRNYFSMALDQIFQLYKCQVCISVLYIYTGKLVYMTHNFILLQLNPFGLRVAREEWWFEHSMSQLRVSLSGEGAKNVSWFSLSPFRGWGSLTMTSTGKFVHMAHHFILLQLYPFGLRVDSEGWRFESSLSQLRVCL